MQRFEEAAMATGGVYSIQRVAPDISTNRWRGHWFYFLLPCPKELGIRHIFLLSTVEHLHPLLNFWCRDLDE